jgi:transposase-like protein
MMKPVRGKTGSYKTAWYMCHRIRAAMRDLGFRQLTDVVEIDETYVGGSGRNAHRGNRGKKTKAIRGLRGNLLPPKIGVVGAIARKGNVTCQMIREIKKPTLRAFIARAVADDVSLVATDDNQAYESLTRDGIPHQSVNHTRGEYVRGHVHTANLDSFWSLLKRGIMGSFHKVSGDYLPLYLNEFSWRHNNRNNPDAFHALLAGC